MNLANYLLKNDVVSVRKNAETWREAVRLATEPLEKANVVSREYYEAIVRNVETNGPYFLLTPGFAMPHAAPESGVFAPGFCLTTLRTPVVFGNSENDPVDLLLCIAAPDRKTFNEDLITQVMDFIDDEKTFPALRRAENVSDVRRFIEENFI